MSNYVCSSELVPPTGEGEESGAGAVQPPVPPTQPVAAGTGLLPHSSEGVGGDSVHFTSATDEWSTPQEFFDRCNALLSFTVDVCCTHENAKCAKHYTRTEDGLSQSWVGERAWMNPPYGRTIGLWMKKAYDESQKGALVVCLVPARTDTRWWHDYATKGTVIFLRGRLKFGRAKNSAPFPSALIVFMGALLGPRAELAQANAKLHARSGGRRQVQLEWEGRGND